MTIIRGEDALDIALKCSAAGKSLTWITSDGREFRPKNMSKGHLINTLNLVGKRYRFRLRAKAQRLFTTSALPENADESSKMVAKAHYWMCLAQNAAALYDRVVAIPITRKMVSVLEDRHGYEYTWHDMREGQPRNADGSLRHDLIGALAQTGRRYVDLPFEPEPVIDSASRVPSIHNLQHVEDRMFDELWN